MEQESIFEFEEQLEDPHIQSTVQLQRDLAYACLAGFTENRISWYRDPSKISLKKLLSKDVVMYAARGVKSAEEFVLESFHACESSSEETVMGNKWQEIITAISADTIDTGDMITVRDGSLYVCELKSQTNTTNSSSFPQELRELKDKCEAQARFKRASNQKIVPAFCVLRSKKPVDEMRVYHADARDQANRDIDGFEYRYLADGAFWRWLTGFDGPEGLVSNFNLLDTANVREARQECIDRLQREMSDALASYNLGSTMNDVAALKQLLAG